MTNDLNNIDKLFKAAIDGHEEEPSPESWRAIDKGLDESNIISIRKKYANLKKLVVILVLLLFGAIAYEWHSAISHDTIIANSNTSDKIGQETKQRVTSSNTVSSNNNSVKADNKKDVNVIVTNLNPSLKQNLGPANVAADKTTLTKNAKHNFIKIHTKAKFSSGITNGEVSELGNGNETTTPSYNTDDKKIRVNSNSVDSFNAMHRQVITNSIVASVAIQPVALQKNILSNIISKDNSSVSNSKGSLRKSSRFSIIPFYSPSLTSDLLDDDDDNHRSNGEDAAHIKKGEHQSSYCFGVSIEYNINKHWSIQSGLTFIQKVSHINPKTIYAEDQGNGDIGYLYDFSSGYSYLSSKAGDLSVGDSAQALRSINVLQYISVPLQAVYTITKGKFSFNATLGAAYNILLKGTLETEVANDSTILNESINKITGLKPGYISGLIGFGAEYPITKKIAVCFNPSYDMAFSSITKNAPVKSYPSFFAFAAGLHIKL